MLLITTRRINEKEESVFFQFNHSLIIEFVHGMAGNMHEFKRVRFQNLYKYPLHLAEHNTLINEYFAKVYCSADPQSIHARIIRDYNRLFDAVYE